MRGKNYWRVEIELFIFCFFLLLPFASAIRINEIMPHPNNSLGDEWIELYNEQNENLSLNGWKIGDKVSNDTINLNITAFGFALIVDSSINCSALNISNCFGLTSIGSGLNDDSEEIYLYNNSSVLISNFSYDANIKSFGYSWQFYNNEWHNCSPTFNTANFCNQTSQSSNQNTTNQTNATDSNRASDEYVRLDYEEMRNGEEFEVEIRAYNLKNGSYDIKIAISFVNNDTIISETYDNGEWKSSNYYVENFFNNSWNKSGIVKLRIKKEYEYFYGEINITAKLRKNGNIVAEIINKTEILKKQVIQEIDNSINQTSNAETNAENMSIIKLNSKDIKSQNISENKTYRTKTQLIKEYGIYGFALFCVFVIIILIINKFR